MTTIFLNTTGTLSPVPIADLGAIEFVHPTVLFEMVGSSGQYSVAELNASLDLQAALTAGYITLEDNNGDPITNIAGYDGSAADILYDNTTTGVAATNVQAALDGVVYTTTNQNVGGVKTFTEDIPLVIDSPSTTANLEFGWFDGTSLDCYGVRRSDASGLFCIMPNSDNPQIFLGNESNTTGQAFIDVDNNRPLNLNVLDTGAGSPAIVNVGSGGLSVGSLGLGIVKSDASGVLSSETENSGFNLALGTTSGTVAEGDHTHPAGDIVSGTFADARISESSVTQHVGAIDHDALLNFVANEHATPKNSIQIDGGQLQLVGDAAAPGNDKVYGTNGSGTKGWYDAATGGAGASISFNWRFDTSTVAGDPGSGDLRYDNATPSSVTNLYISSVTDNGAEINNILGAISTSSRFYIQTIDDSTEYLLADVSGTPTDNTGWWTIPVTVLDSGTLPANNEKIGMILFLVATDAGGDVTAAAALPDNSIMRGDGGAKGIQGTTQWSITDDGLFTGTTSRSGYVLELTNTLLTGGGNGMLICGGDQTGDIAMRICDSDNSLTLMEYEANGQGIIIGDTWANADASPVGAFGMDIRWPGGFENPDYNTQNGNYRIGGEIVPIHSYVFRAETWQSPRGTDWAVNDFASISADSNNSGLRVRRFDDTTAEGVGQIVHVPINATDVVFRFVSRAETAPGGAQTVSLNFYERGMPDNGAVDAWSTAVAFADLSMPTNENWQTDTETFTLAALGLTAGQTHQIEITRDGAGTLTGDWTLLSLVVEFI